MNTTYPYPQSPYPSHKNTPNTTPKAPTGTSNLPAAPVLLGANWVYVATFSVPLKLLVLLTVLVELTLPLADNTIPTSVTFAAFVLIHLKSASNTPGILVPARLHASDMTVDAKHSAAVWEGQKDERQLWCVC